MKKEENINKLIEKLSQTKPVLHTPELMTESIMQQIKIAKLSNSIPKYLMWVRIITSSAAILLLGLFLFQQTEYQGSTTTTQFTSIINKEIKIKSKCEIKNLQHANLLEVYFCHIQQNTIKNHKFKSLIANLNENHHENNN